MESLFFNTDTLGKRYTLEYVMDGAEQFDVAMRAALATAGGEGLKEGEATGEGETGAEGEGLTIREGSGEGIGVGVGMGEHVVAPPSA